MIRKLIILLTAFAYYSLHAQELKGLVTDEIGMPIVGAVVELHELNQAVVTENDGSFLFDEIPSTGHLHIHVRAIGYGFEVLDIELPNFHVLEIQMRPTLIELSEAVVEDDLLRLDTRKTPQEVIRLNAKQLSESGFASLAMGLDRLPGVQSIQTGVGIAKPVIRGFSGARIQVLSDGIKQEGQQWGQDHGLEIDAFSANEIEIIKGAAALQYGPDATAGVMKILSAPLPNQGIHGGVSVLGRSNNVSGAGSLLFTYRKKNWFLGMRNSYDRAGDYRVPADRFIYNTYVLPIVNGRLKNTAYQQLNTTLYGGYIGRNSVMRWSYSRFNQFSGLFPGAVAIPGFNDLTNPGDRYDIEIPSQTVIHDKFALQWLEHLGEYTWQTEWGYQNNKRLETSSPLGHGITYVNPNDSAALGLILSTWTLNSALSGHDGKYKWTTGVQSEYQINHRSGWDFLLPDFTRLQFGVFGVANLAVHEHLHIQAGLRYDMGSQQSNHFDQPYFAKPDSLVRRVNDFDKLLHGFSGSIGLSYMPNKLVTFKGQIARTYRMPQAVEWSSNGVHHGTFRHELGDESLNPEIAWQSDLSFIYQSESYLLRLSPYLNYFDNYIYLRPSGVFSTLPDAGQVYRYSQAKVLHTGFEVYNEWHPFKSIHFEISGEYLYAQNLNTLLSLPFTPPARVFSGIDYEIKSSHSTFHIALEGEYNFSQFRTDRNELPTSGYHLFHVKFSVENPLAIQNTSVSLYIQNLTNEVYLRHLSRYRLLGMPEQGRNVTLRFNYQF